MYKYNYLTIADFCHSYYDRHSRKAAIGVGNLFTTRDILDFPQSRHSYLLCFHTIKLQCVLNMCFAPFYSSFIKNYPQIIEVPYSGTFHGKIKLKQEIYTGSVHLYEIAHNKYTYGVSCEDVNMRITANTKIPRNYASSNDGNATIWSV